MSRNALTIHYKTNARKYLKEELGPGVPKYSSLYSNTEILIEETMASDWFTARNRPVSRNIFYHITSDDFYRAGYNESPIKSKISSFQQFH